MWLNRLSHYLFFFYLFFGGGGGGESVKSGPHIIQFYIVLCAHIT